MAQIVIDYALLAISIVILATCTGIIWIVINRRAVERIASYGQDIPANNNATPKKTIYHRTASRSRAGGVGGPYPTDIGYDAGYGDNTVYYSGGGSGDSGHSSAEGGSGD